MRWIWFDRFELFESGRRAVAVKNITLAEDHLHDHFPGLPVMPASLMIEGMAQTAGILVGEARQFAEKVILAKIKRAAFNALVRPGDQVRYHAEIEQITPSAASTAGRITRGDELIGEVDIVFSHIDQNMSGLEFPEDNFVFTEEFLALLRTYRAGAGQRITL
ncbi:MAG: beta-hydroxyacyl-ACP dehydratase [Phycisphaerae bacterium]|nr:beta-hydroxyacyl-ACP dehydratase [Phycisphaerae bacterium]MCZ2400334.1 beta-hydroxyacyl-ACP dehydratase [Phycisphaerae bacterium]NUQ50556.1 beta-hydroxyacyl-ACP dehydratase [Phycisphaerae bacterium]